MQRYFKLVCRHEDPAWYIGEFLAGRARFGWSGPGTDLRAIKKKMDAGLRGDRTEQEAVAWTYTKFLIERLKAGDRLVIQPERPSRRFLLAEVVDPIYQFSPGDMDDFNHVINVKPLTTQAISVNARAVSAALKHDLSKLGHYYQIYPEDSIRELNAIVTKVEDGTLTKAIEHIVTGYSTLKNRKALEEIRDLRRRLLNEYRIRSSVLKFENIGRASGRISIVEAALSRLQDQDPNQLGVVRRSPLR
jgi:hypothetical protein